MGVATTKLAATQITRQQMTWWLALIPAVMCMVGLIEVSLDPRGMTVP